MSCTDLIQVVDFPTFINVNSQKSSKLDLTLTNLDKWYSKSLELPPLKIGTVYYICIQYNPVKTIKRKERKLNLIKYRIYTNDNLYWRPFFESECINFKVEYMNCVLQKAFETTFPLKEKSVNMNDNLWMNKKLQELFFKHKKMRTNSREYTETKKQIAAEVKLAKQHYNELI